ncbi:unnamed protein product [Rotaria sp. Silwood1]|nr:unnamed protein product [Rotaria sp. Silwood1]
MTLISLTIEYLFIKNIYCDLNDLSHLFKHKPHLKKLYQNIECNFKNEQLHIICSSIISLKLIFEEKEIDVLLDSFRNPFWINIYQWFVRCDWYSINATLYILSYAFDEFIYSNNYQSKSTCLNNNDY